MSNLYVTGGGGGQRPPPGGGEDEPPDTSGKFSPQGKKPFKRTKKTKSPKSK